MYSVEQDNLYILGEKCTFKSKNRQVFLVKNIENVQLLDIENDIYESKEYLDIAEKMFDISYSDPVSVKVRFVDYGNVIEKVQKLASSRMYATFEKADDGNWYYTDEVCGISDFMSYLRSFGRSCEVLEPIELREQVKWSTNFTLERYAKEGLCDVE